MGYMRHHAIVVTSWKNEAIEEVHAKAMEIFDPALGFEGRASRSAWVSPVGPPAMNGYRSFFIGPDGSKEGWEESDEGDRRRDQFMAWLESTRMEDGGHYCEWVEVQYRDDHLVTRVTRDSDDFHRAKLLAVAKDAG